MLSNAVRLKVNPKVGSVLRCLGNILQISSNLHRFCNEILHIASRTSQFHNTLLAAIQLGETWWLLPHPHTSVEQVYFGPGDDIFRRGEACKLGEALMFLGMTWCPRWQRILF